MNFKQLMNGSPKDLFSRSLDQEKVIESRFDKMTFRTFMEMSKQPATVQANIPIPKECLKIAEALTKNYPRTEVYAVGGAVRDFLFGKMPKDVDLTTNLSDKEIIERVERAGFSVMTKNSETFGVIFVHTNSGEREPTEVAPFRSDEGVADGRRPDAVTFGVDISQDAERRDFTMNNLYYDFGYGKYGKNLILDFNDEGQGLKDIKNKTVRTVGDPNERFIEDRLRILRLMRFFSRFNSGDITKFVDEKTIQAINRLGDLKNPIDLGDGRRLAPIAPERIQTEFLSGLRQAQRTYQYVANYAKLGLLDVVFPKLQVDTSQLQVLQNTKNPDVVLAWILRGNQNVEKQLLDLKYSSNQAERIQFLIDTLHFGIDDAFDMIKRRDRALSRTVKIDHPENPGEQIQLSQDQLSAQLSQDLRELAKLTGNKQILQTLTHLGGHHQGEKWHHPPYQPPKFDAQQLMSQGFKGPALGKEIKNRTISHYGSSLEDFKNKNKTEF